MRKHAGGQRRVRTVSRWTATTRSPPRHGTTCKLGEKNGWRNAQASVLAPTGTIGFMMDCDTTGIEPDFSLVKFKKLVGGGSMQIVNQTIPRALRQARLPAEETIEAIVEYIATRATSSTRRASRPSTTRSSTARWASARSARWATCG
jgi:ribonucleoside-diphosphate reductase alpha chain